MYSTTLSLTSALDGDGWSTPRTGRFTPGKESRWPFYRQLGGRPGPFRMRGETSPPPEFDPRTVQSVASRYTDSAIHSMLHTITVHNLQLSYSKFLFNP